MEEVNIRSSYALGVWLLFLTWRPFKLQNSPLTDPKGNAYKIVLFIQNIIQISLSLDCVAMNRTLRVSKLVNFNATTAYLIFFPSISNSINGYLPGENFIEFFNVTLPYEILCNSFLLHKLKRPQRISHGKRYPAEIGDI